MIVANDEQNGPIVSPPQVHPNRPRRSAVAEVYAAEAKGAVIIIIPANKCISYLCVDTVLFGPDRVSLSSLLILRCVNDPACGGTAAVGLGARD
jgi:hypothetical protein